MTNTITLLIIDILYNETKTNHDFDEILMKLVKYYNNAKESNFRSYLKLISCTCRYTFYLFCSRIYKNIYLFFMKIWFILYRITFVFSLLTFYMYLSYLSNSYVFTPDSFVSIFFLLLLIKLLVISVLL